MFSRSASKSSICKGGRFLALFHSWKFVTMPIRSITKALTPRLATLSATYTLRPFSTEITETNVVTARITPSNVKKVRSLWARKVSRAIQKVSRTATSVCLTSARVGVAFFTLSILDDSGPRKVHNLDSAARLIEFEGVIIRNAELLQGLAALPWWPARRQKSDQCLPKPQIL